jgi:hypothetical protein
VVEEEIKKSGDALPPLLINDPDLPLLFWLHGTCPTLTF